MKARRVFLIMLALLVATSSVFGLDLKKGRIKLVLYPDTGRFSAYYLTDMTKNSYTSLFYDQDPRTTALSVLIGNTIYRMGDSYEFRQQLKQTDTGAQFVWTSRMATIVEDFSFLSSSSSPVVNGFKIAVTITNGSNQDLSIGARYLIDTYLGEKSQAQFVTDTVPAISSETEMDPPSLPKWWESTADSSQPVGLEVMTQGQGVTPPDRLVFANWKRLNDSPWSYTTNAGQNFNLLPYSINDSAVAMYYNPVTVKAGASREIDLLMGNWTQEGYSVGAPGPASSAIAAIFNSAVTSAPQQQSGSAATSPRAAVQSDLLTVQDLLTQINQKLDSGAPVTQSDLDLMNQVIQKLQQRKTTYEQQ